MTKQAIQTKSYPFTLAAGAAAQLDVQGAFYKVQQATGNVEIRRDGGISLTLAAGQGEKDVEFQRLELRNPSGATITGVVLIGGSTFIDDTVVIGTGSTVPVEDRGVVGASVTSNISLSGAGVVAVIAPGSNLTGMLIENCGAVCNAATGSGGNFVITRKDSAPVVNTDGKIVTYGWPDAVVGANQYSRAYAENVSLAAGDGLYINVFGSGAMAGLVWVNARAL
jgi:hypothetical protein